MSIFFFLSLDSLGVSLFTINPKTCFLEPCLDIEILFLLIINFSYFIIFSILELIVLISIFDNFLLELKVRSSAYLV